MWGTRRRESQKARTDITSEKKLCHKDKKTGAKEKGNLRGQLHLIRCFEYMLPETKYLPLVWEHSKPVHRLFSFSYSPPPSPPRKFGAP